MITELVPAWDSYQGIALAMPKCSLPEPAFSRCGDRARSDSCATRSPERRYDATEIQRREKGGLVLQLRRRTVREANVRSGADSRRRTRSCIPKQAPLPTPHDTKPRPNPHKPQSARGRDPPTPEASVVGRCLARFRRRRTRRFQVCRECSIHEQSSALRVRENLLT